MRDVLFGVSKNGMECFVSGCFVLQSLLHIFIHHRVSDGDIRL